MGGATNKLERWQAPTCSLKNFTSKKLHMSTKQTLKVLVFVIKWAANGDKWAVIAIRPKGH